MTTAPENAPEKAAEYAGRETATRLILVRHGESTSTVERIVGGHQGCTGLSPRGRKQAEALRARLAQTGEFGEHPVLLTSILPRAIETAGIIAPALGDGELEARQDCDFCEIHPGEGDGLQWDEFQTRFRPEGGTAARNPYREVAPGGESWASFFLRVGTVLLQAAEDHRGETIVVVCHGGVVEASFVSLGHQPIRRGFDVAVENTSITEWRRAGRREEDGSGEERWRLMRFNDAAHLHGVD